MATKKNNYAAEELEWLEARALEIKQYVDANPYHLLKDRKVSIMTGRGPMDKIVATIEAQQKAHRESLRDYGLLIEVISSLREKEEAKKNDVRGDQDLSPLEDGEI